MKERLALYAAIALVLIGLGAGTVWYMLSGTIAQLKTDKRELETLARKAAEAKKAERIVLQQRATVRQQRVTESVAIHARDDSALAAHKAWADEPLPQEVRDALAQ